MAPLVYGSCFVSLCIWQEVEISDERLRLCDIFLLCVIGLHPISARYILPTFCIVTALALLKIKGVLAMWAPSRGLRRSYGLRIELPRVLVYSSSTRVVSYYLSTRNFPFPVTIYTSAHRLQSFSVLVNVAARYFFCCCLTLAGCIIVGCGTLVPLDTRRCKKREMRNDDIF